MWPAVQKRADSAKVSLRMDEGIRLRRAHLLRRRLRREIGGLGKAKSEEEEELRANREEKKGKRMNSEHRAQNPSGFNPRVF
jgi:hypothetical protein